MFTREEIALEYIEVTEAGPALEFAFAAWRSAEQERVLATYHRLHADPVWRRARAAKMRAYRLRLKGLK